MRPGTAPAQQAGRARLPSEGRAVRARAQTRMQTEKESMQNAPWESTLKRVGFRKGEEGAKHSFLTTAPSHEGRQQSHNPQQEEQPWQAFSRAEVSDTQVQRGTPMPRVCCCWGSSGRVSHTRCCQSSRSPFTDATSSPWLRHLVKLWAWLRRSQMWRHLSL